MNKRFDELLVLKKKKIAEYLADRDGYQAELQTTNPDTGEVTKTPNPEKKADYFWRREMERIVQRYKLALAEDKGNEARIAEIESEEI